MDLLRWERDYYDITYETDPPLTGTVEASFDGGQTWIPGTPSGSHWTWLLAGPDYVADELDPEQDPDDTQFTITGRTIPKLRLADDPVLDGKNGPPITLKN